MKRVLGILSALAVAVSLAAAVPADPARAAAPGDDTTLRVPLGDRAARAATPPAGSVLVRQRASLTMRSPGLPAAGTPAYRQLASASIDMEVTGFARGEPTWFLGGAGNLRAAPPTADDDARVRLLLGHISGGNCTLSTLADSHGTRSGRGTRYDWVGYSGPDGYFPRPSRPWDCAGVLLVSLDGATTYDALAGPLTSTYQRPKVALGKVELLGQQQRRLRLVRGVPTQVQVTVRNRGKAPARAVRLTGKGRGVKVGRARVATLAAGAATTLTVPVRLTGRKSTKVRLRVAGVGTAATRTLRVVRTAPPRRPVAGSYRSPKGDVRFRIARGRIVGWTGSMQQRCGGQGTIPTYQRVTLDFPRTRIPANGIVLASARGASYGTTLRLRIAGAKVTRGLFTYADTALCRASVTFNARRTGR